MRRIARDAHVCRTSVGLCNKLNRRNLRTPKACVNGRSCSHRIQIPARLTVHARKEQRCKNNSKIAKEEVFSQQWGRLRMMIPTVSYAWLFYLVLALPAIAESEQSGGYVPSPYTPGWEIWIGFAAGVIPFIIGGYEFTKRIVIQQRCERCKGSGLVPKRNYKTERDLRKCPDCGGFFPWQGWGKFFTSTALPGNGGPLMAPKGQDNVFYKVPAKPQDWEKKKIAKKTRLIQHKISSSDFVMRFPQVSLSRDSEQPQRFAVIDRVMSTGDTRYETYAIFD